MIRQLGLGVNGMNEIARIDHDKNLIWPKFDFLDLLRGLDKAFLVLRESGNDVFQFVAVFGRTDNDYFISGLLVALDPLGDLGIVGDESVHLTGLPIFL